MADREERQSDETSSLREPLLALGQSLHESQMLIATSSRLPPQDIRNGSRRARTKQESESQSTSEEQEFATAPGSRVPSPESPTTSAAAPPPVFSTTPATELQRRRIPATSTAPAVSQPQLSRQYRVLDRDANFHQSRGRWQVQRRARGVRLYHGHGVRRVYDDWFHSLAYKPTLVLMGILFLLYTTCVFFFAFVYLGVSVLGEKITTNPADGTITTHSFCGMDITNHMEALYFSLSTMTTIGYGVSDYYFGDCWTPLLLVLWQSCTSITFSAVAIGLLFQRISRGQKRGKTIVFSDKAVIRRVRGVSYLMFRVGELRRHHLIEVTVRAYCLMHDRQPRIGMSSPQHSNDRGDLTPHEIETTHFLTRQMRLLHPDDDTVGSHILMGVPQMIVHRLDERSPLCTPRPCWYDAQGHKHRSCQHGEDVWQYLCDREAEIVVLLEGSDELTGSSLQTRHSYRADDIVWDQTFAPCVFPSRNDGTVEDDSDEYGYALRSWVQRRNCQQIARAACYVDYTKFHDLVPAPPDCTTCPYVPDDTSY